MRELEFGVWIKGEKYALGLAANAYFFERLPISWPLG